MLPYELYTQQKDYTYRFVIQSDIRGYENKNKYITREFHKPISLHIF